MPIRLSFPRRKSAGHVVEILPDQPSSESSFRVLDRDEVERQRTLAREVRMKNTPVNESHTSPLGHHQRPKSFHAQYLASRTNISSSATAAAASSSALSFHSSQPSSIGSESHDERDEFENHPSSRSLGRPIQQASYLTDNNTEEQENSPKLSRGRKRFSIALPKFGRPEASPPTKGKEAPFRTTRGRSQTITSVSSNHSSAVSASELDLGADFYPPQRRSWFDRIENNQGTLLTDDLGAVRALERPPPVLRSESNSPVAPRNQLSLDGFDERRLPLSSTLDKAPSPERAPRTPLENRYSTASFHSRIPPSPGSDGHSPGLTDSRSFLDGESDVLMGAAYASQALDSRYGTPTGRFMNQPRSYNTATTPSPYSGRLKEVSTPVKINGQLSSNNNTPRSGNNDDSEDDDEAQDSLFDACPAVTKVRNIRSQSPATPRNTRVMTIAEFERAKQVINETTDDRKENEASEESNLYDDDEDDSERERQVAKQRKRQEASLAVYRQQMRKVTGERFADLSDGPTTRPGFRRATHSLPDLAHRVASSAVAENNYGGTDDADDEIPLGVLQAHGFPSKSRPPTRMSSPTRPVTPMASYPAPAGSTRNDSDAGGGGSTTLPPFARNLPLDPYAGADLVHPANRQSLTYNGSSPTATTPLPSSPIPPGGLVGVIVGEERARAMRRGSPNTNGVYGTDAMHQQLTPQQSYLQLQQQMQQQAQTSSNEQAQLQMSNSMAQMMQMQMQWMQQMMHMQAMTPQPSTPMEQSPNGPSNSHQRSSSSASSHLLVSRPPSVFGVQPAASIDGIRGRYAPSVAPSERSNVGQPPRYRPVTPSQLYNPRSRSPGQPGPRAAHPGQTSFGSTVRAVSRPKRGAGGGLGGGSDDEDDAGWAEMKRKREARKSRWRPKSEIASGLSSQASSTSGSLYYGGSSISA